MSLILRNVKGQPLTYTEMDDNLVFLEGIAGEIQGNLTGEVNTDGNDIKLTSTDKIFNTDSGDLVSALKLDPNTSGTTLITEDLVTNEKSFIEMSQTLLTSVVNDGTNDTNVHTSQSYTDTHNVEDATGVLKAAVELDPGGANNGNRLFAKDGANESSVAFGGNGIIKISSTGGLNALNVGGLTIKKSEISSSVTDGSNTGSINTFGDGTIDIFSSDGKNTSTQTIIPDDVTTLVDTTAGTPGAYEATFRDVKGDFRVQIPNDSLSSFFNIANDIVIYFPSDDSTFNPIDIDQITIFEPGPGFPNGRTQLHLNGEQGISNTFVDEQCFVITPDLGGTGTETIPTLPIQSTSTITLNSTQVLLNRTEASSTNEIDINDNSIVLSSINGTDTATVELDPTDTSNGNRLFATNGTNESSVVFLDSDILISSTDGNSVSSINTVKNGTIDISSSYDNKSTAVTITPITISSTVTDGVNTNSITLTPTNLNISNLPAFDDDTDASTLVTGDLYQTTGLGASPLDVAGILMIKQ